MKERIVCALMVILMLYVLYICLPIIKSQTVLISEPSSPDIMVIPKDPFTPDNGNQYFFVE